MAYQMWAKPILPDEEIVKGITYHCPTCDQKLVVSGFTARCVDHCRDYKICGHCWHLVDNIRVQGGKGVLCGVCSALSELTEAGRAALQEGAGHEN